jgi:hypothetical protein
MENLEQLRHAVHKWMVKHELTRDTRFYTPEAWEAREIVYLRDADLVLVFEGALYKLIYGRDRESFELYQEFEHLVRGSTSSVAMRGIWGSIPCRRCVAIPPHRA